MVKQKECCFKSEEVHSLAVAALYASDTQLSRFLFLPLWKGGCPGWGAPLVRVSPRYIKVMGSISGQGTYKNQPMNASVSGTTNWWLSLSQVNQSINQPINIKKKIRGLVWIGIPTRLVFLLHCGSMKQEVTGCFYQQPSHSGCSFMRQWALHDFKWSSTLEKKEPGNL